MSDDRIEKTAVLPASPSRVWRALTDADEFGSWFGVKFHGAVFSPGASVSGNVTYPGYEHYRFEAIIDQMQPERLFSYRWHPFPEPGVDASEPMTLVEFRLEPAAGGTRLTVNESGFHRIPQPRRETAFSMNDGGWTGQMENIRRHLAG